jgi:hypothetical protein
MANGFWRAALLRCREKSVLNKRTLHSAPRTKHHTSHSALNLGSLTLTIVPLQAVGLGTEHVARSDTSKQPMQYRRLAVGICRWDTSRGLGLSPLSRFGSGLGQGCESDKGSVLGPRPGQLFGRGNPRKPLSKFCRRSPMPRRHNLLCPSRKS